MASCEVARSNGWQVYFVLLLGFRYLNICCCHLVVLEVVGLKGSVVCVPNWSIVSGAFAAALLLLSSSIQVLRLSSGQWDWLHSLCLPHWMPLYYKGAFNVVYGI